MRRPFRLTLLCHGRTTAMAAGFPGNEPLAEGESARVYKLATGLARADRLLAAPARAAVQTAELLDMDPDIDSALRDLDYGRWIGRSFEEIHRSEPQGIADWLADPNATPHGGESIRELVDRMAIWMNARLGEGGHWIAVTHPSVIRAMIMATLGAPPSAYWHIDIQHLGVADIRSDGTRFALRSLGRLD